MRDDYDAIVIGARVAGSTVSALLGDAGYRVLLLDRARFPSPTLSTHFFRGAGMVTALDRLGILPDVLALGSPPLIRQYVYPGGAATPLVEPPQDPGAIGYCLSVRREPLDALLLRRAARSSTVDIQERTRATGLVWAGERVAGVQLATASGARSVRARIVIGADGRHSFLAREVQAPIEETTPPLRALYYTYVQNFLSPDGAPLSGPEFSLIEDELAYVFPSDDGMTCIALSLNRRDFAWFKQALPDRFHERLSEHQGVAARVAAATPVSPILGCGPERNYVRVPVGPGWALVGDAGMHQDPWSGMGMDMASTHAVFLAEAVISWFAGTMSEGEALATYHQRRNSHGTEAYRQTVTFGRDLRQMA